MFDAKAFIADEFAGPRNLHEWLTTRGVDAKLSAVRKWYARNSISAEKIVQILVLLDREGRPVDLSKYVREPVSCPRLPSPKKPSHTGEPLDVFG